MHARFSADYLIIGSGIAGLRAAVTLAPYGRVLVLTKSDRGAGSTGYAQGGIAAAVGPDDSSDLHAADTIAAGAGLSDETAVRVLVDDGPRYVRELIDWGAAFDRQADGALALAIEGAHSVRRVLHAHDATGREIGRVLAARIAGESSVTILDHCLVTGLTVDDGRAAGATFLDADGRLCDVRASATLLASGGAGQVFRETTNPPVATGDGITLGFLAGARVADLEFVQFHPTALHVAGAPRYLLSEALRGEGAQLINIDGERFMSRYDPAGELAPRDRVARAMVLEAERTGAPVSLSMAHVPAADVRERFPLITQLCRRAGLDLATDRIPVGPAAHYLMGGVTTDLEGRTSVRGLFAAGEVACTGVHGANRLASNSLLEGLVFGARAGAAMPDWAAGAWPIGSTAVVSTPAPVVHDGHESSRITEAQVRDLMWKSVGIFRDRDGLSRALDVLDAAAAEVDHDAAAGVPHDAATWRLASIITVGRLIARAALRREESRGAHSRTDFPDKDDLHWKRHCEERRAVEP